MKVAVTSEGPTLQDMVDPRFGRAAGFVVVDTASMATTWLENGASQAMAHGAGLQAAQRMADAGVRAVLTGQVGPKAAQALAAVGIATVEGLQGLSVAQAVDSYLARAGAGS